MSRRPYLHALTQRSKPLIAVIVLGALTALTVVAVWVLQFAAGYDADFLASLVPLLMVALVICAGAELAGNETRWVRALGVTLIVLAVLSVLLLLLILWYASALCDGNCG